QPFVAYATKGCSLEDVGRHLDFQALHFVMVEVTGKKPLMWGRVLCAGVTVVALGFVLHRLDLKELTRALRVMHWGCFAGALVLFGLVFLPAAGRWRLVLRLMGRAVSFSVIARVSLIGHFFYTVMF